MIFDDLEKNGAGFRQRKKRPEETSHTVTDRRSFQRRKNRNPPERAKAWGRDGGGEGNLEKGKTKKSRWPVGAGSVGRKDV